jgi:predicted nucleotidyltransferase
MPGRGWLHLCKLTIEGYEDKIKIGMKKADVDTQAVIKKLKGSLAGEKNVIFAYLHGSFVHQDGFKDVDVAVYIGSPPGQVVDVADYEISLSIRLEKEMRLPIDVRVLNHAPLSYRYHASCGILLLTRDESERENFLNRTWSEYFDFLPLSRIYYEELTRA